MWSVHFFSDAAAADWLCSMASLAGPEIVKIGETDSVTLWGDWQWPWPLSFVCQSLHVWTLIQQSMTVLWPHSLVGQTSQVRPIIQRPLTQLKSAPAASNLPQQEMVGAVVATGRFVGGVVAEVFIAVPAADDQHSGGHGGCGSSHWGSAMNVR